jgi:vancomycin permeability regulator SanA
MMAICMRRKLIKRSLVALSVAYLSGIAALCWAGLSDHLGYADTALVLGNKVNPDGSLSPRLEGRMAEAVSRYREGRFQRIIVSGATGREGIDEAQAMRGYLLQRDVPAESIVVDSNGANTFASARFTADYLQRNGLRSVLVITQYFHVPRTELALRKFGVPEVYSAHAHYFEWRDLFSVQRELFGYVRYWTRSYAVGG